ncbi:YdeI/OmpD-associated family protein [Haloechinothrix sp. LS1_15]|uniref:YdeI/OmpD-associated family protein n=1 Tax=Haloechinothrix sp. LS1_15 TaxID=2652248 RepID=UPI002947B754|nr:YdeI/OmpD-associated family protein [Haloechinothrix sp. LS1_15]MDV6012770.1 DUF1905 domain-containing protein [Haloechinothrix sp. LS1_15]
MEPVTVEVTLQQLEGASSSAFARLPLDVTEVFGQPRPPVRVTINDHTYASTVVVYDNAPYIPVNRANCEMAGVQPGDTVTMTLDPVRPRVDVEPPEELLRALGDVRPRWDSLPYERRRSLARWVAESRSSEIQQRRITRTIEELRR